MFTCLVGLLIFGFAFSLMSFMINFLNPQRGDIPVFSIIMFVTCFTAFTLAIQVGEELDYYQSITPPDKRYEVLLLTKEVEKIKGEIKHYESGEQE